MIKGYSGFGKLKGFAIILFMGLLTLSLFACGSGGGGGGSSSNHSSLTTNNSTILTGVAATGAPMSGGSVYLKEADGTEHGPYPIDNNGKYSIDVTGFTPPFYLRAQRTTGGQTTYLYSVSMGAGTANINPLTNLAVAAAGIVNDPADVYKNPVIRPIAQGALDKAITDILALMAPVLNNPKYHASSSNFLTDGNYKADHKGLDGVFDDLNLDIKITPGVVMIKLNGKPIGQVQLNKLESSSIAAADVEAALAKVSVSGSGINSSFSMLTLNNVNSSPLGGTVTYYDALSRLNFASTSVTGVSVVNGTATITGEGTVPDISGYPISGYTFTATVINGTASIQLHAPQTVINGNYTVSGASISGSGASSGSILNIVSVTSSPLGGTVTFYDAPSRLDFVSSSIVEVSAAGGTAAISGGGTVTDISGYEIPGYTFTATVTNTTATIQLHLPNEVIDGNYNVTIE